MGILSIPIMMAIGWVGCVVFRILRLPTPTLLGSLAIVAIIQLVGIELPVIPSDYGFVLQIIIGMSIGVDLTKETCKQLKSVAKPVALMSMWVIVITILAGYLLERFTSMDRLSAYLAAAPGGLTDMSIIAQDVGADLVSVTILQLLRMLLTLALFPLIARRGMRKDEIHSAGTKVSTKDIIDNYRPSKLFPGIQKKIKLIISPRFLIAISSATAGGICGRLLSIPAGGMLGAMFATAAISIFGGIEFGQTPQFLKSFATIGVGVTLGDDFSSEILQQFASMLLPCLIFTVLIFGTSQIMRILVQKVSKWDPLISFLSTAPAGIIPMTAVAQELNLSALEVNIVHLARILTLRIFIPVLIIWLR